MLYRLNFASSLRRNAAYAILATTVGVALALLSAVEYNKMLRHLEDVRIEAEVADLTREIRSRLDTRLHALQFMAEQGRAGRLNTKEEFELAAAAITNVAHEFLAINWIDADRRITFVWPPQNEAQTLGKVVGQSPSILALINAARSTGQPKSTALVPLFQGGLGVATYFPVWKGDEFKGYVNGVFRIDGLREVVAPIGSHPSLLPEIEIAESANIESDATHIRTAISLLDKSLVIVVARPTMPSLYRLANPYSYYGVPGSILGGFLLFIGLQNRTARSRQHSMLSTILTAAPDAIVTIDEDYKIVVYNPAAEKMFGWNRAEMLGQSMDRLIPEQERHKHDAHIREFETSSAVTRQMNKLRITHGLRADGEEIPIAITLSKARFENKVLMTAVMRDISQTLNLNNQLMQLAEDRSRQAEKAQEANKAKTTFLATMSHELRTPLNAIIGFSEFMQTEALGPLGNAKYREYVDDILKSGRQLLEIINDILDLSKIEAGAYRFNPEMFAVAPVIRAVRDVAVPMFLEKNLDLILECNDKLEAYADKRATRQILVNLISNAIKFTPRGGRISIRAQMGEQRGMVEFRISDTGCGISAENLERIWQPFVQVGDAYRAEVKGTGLGLAISRSFAEGMGGDIRIESQFGVGTTVILRLPASNLLPAVVGEAR